MIEQLGPYRIEKLLGRGGMGTVFAGVHQATGERAAIKVLSLVLADDGSFRERFVGEIETLKQLDHPNIVKLLGEGEQDGYLFFVMELVDGSSLQAGLQGGTVFEWRQVVDIGIQVCAALKHAHDRGIIHRDLKPANLLRTSNGLVKLTDFGIARLFGATRLTMDGSVVGTADFMAPEQAEGKLVTNRTDLYNLGSLLYALLARRPPFSAPSVAQVIHKLRYEQPVPLRRYAPDVPRELEEVIDQLLKKDPQQRIPTALVLSRRLRSMQLALAGERLSGDAEGGAANIGRAEADPAPASHTAPTAIDTRPSSPRAEAYSWNDVTRATTVKGQASVESDRQPVPSAASDSGSRPARFATVAERSSSDSHAEPSWRGPDNPLQTTALAAVLLALIAAATWWAWPPSADKLHRQITAIVAESEPADAKRYIDQFLDKYPHDPRAVEVQRLRLDIESQWLQSRLALQQLKTGGSALEPYEELLLQGMRIKENDPQAAVELFRGLLAQFEDLGNKPDRLRQCLTAARHQLERLEPSRPTTRHTST